ncbi:SusC/RagA family TonB-linked outer membrane protein [Maribacter sp. 2304DJ31-5]|uniref:SusC/RagA family TonB-linked outer membrane protein n=1 Tax=Maribacter sp. 2304DJ31-5 TaxID=3386273 RepID=UPI0039BC6A15
MKINFKKAFLHNGEKLLKTIMRTFLFLCFTTVLSFTPNDTFSQNAKIFIETDKEISVSQIFELIQEQAGYKFVYSDEIIVNAPKVELKKGVIRANELLKKGLSPIGCTFEFTKNETVIVKKKSRVDSVNALQVSVIGTVKDNSGQPLPGANVIEKGTTNGAQTDFDGNYTITVSNNDAVLVFSYLGFTAKEVVVGDQTNINVQLAEDSAKLDEVVVIGYGSTTTRKVISAISSLKSEGLKDLPITSFDQGIAGKLPGIDISTANGAPGAEVDIKIRGNNSINGRNNPLIVVDGVPFSNSLNDNFSQGRAAFFRFNNTYRINLLGAINPGDIESVEVLKDAAAAAIYGSRGSNGVILITTKKGKRNEKTKINVNAYTGIQQITKKVDMMNAQEFSEYTALARGLSHVARDPLNNSIDDPNEDRVLADRLPPHVVATLNGSNGVDVDWQDELFRTAFVQKYDVSFLGGSENTSYYASGSYTNQEGIIINSGLEQYTGRLNLETTFNDKLTFGLNMNPSYTDNKLAHSEANFWREGLIFTTLMMHPNLPSRDANGDLVIDAQFIPVREGTGVIANLPNPVALANETITELEHLRFLASTYLNFDFTEELSFRTSFGVDYNNIDRFFYRPGSIPTREEPNSPPATIFNYAFSNQSRSLNWITENYFTFDKSFDKHNLNILAGFSAQKETNSRDYVEGNTFPNDNVTTINAAQNTFGFTEERESSLLSYTSRISYDYDSRYLLSFSLRRDGSSRFGDNTRWGWFPAVSAGWRMSDEDFLKESDLISDLKFRGSWGRTGSTDIPFYGSSALLGTSNYVLDGSVTNGLSPSTSPNPDLGWEETTTVNVGMNLGLFSNKLTLSADYYVSNTRDLLLQVTLPGSSGFTSSLQNIGEVQNKGFELQLGTTQQFGELKWTGTLNYYTNENEIISLGPGQDRILFGAADGFTGLPGQYFALQVGESTGSFFGYKVDGVFESQAQFDSTPHLEGQNQAVGDLIYVDNDGDGDVDADDRTIIGNSNPDFSWGFGSTFEFKGFDLAFNLQGEHGAELFNSNLRYLSETWGNNLDVWRTGFDDIGTPRPVWGVGNGTHVRASELHINDASFVRLREITLGYTLPEKVFDNSFVSNLRFYVTALNPITWDNYDLGYNPEVNLNGGDAIRSGEDFGNHPLTKQFILGVNLSF